MTRDRELPPVRKAIEVGVPPAEAFRLWTEGSPRRFVWPSPGTPASARRPHHGRSDLQPDRRGSHAPRTHSPRLAARRRRSPRDYDQGWQALLRDDFAAYVAAAAAQV